MSPDVLNIAAAIPLIANLVIASYGLLFPARARVIVSVAIWLTAALILLLAAFLAYWLLRPIQNEWDKIVTVLSTALAVLLTIECLALLAVRRWRVRGLLKTPAPPAAP